MTWQLDNRRPIDRAPQPKRHTGPYYGSALRRLLAAVPPDDAHDRDRQMTWLIVMIAVPAAVILAALIVMR